MRIANNLMAINTHRQMGVTTANASKSMEKLSSGYRINRGADDAAGLAVSEKMRGQIRGLSQASRNAQDGISYIQTAEGAMNEISNMLTRLKELLVQEANGTYQAADKTNIGYEKTALKAEIDNILDNTKFNGIAVFTADTDISIADDGGAIKLTIAKATFVKGDAVATVANVEAAIDKVNADRANYGAWQNRLESVTRNLDNNVENLQAAESRIRDTDMAKEMMAFTKNNILLQASQAMLAQANQAPQGVLQLLR